MIDGTHLLAALAGAGFVLAWDLLWRWANGLTVEQTRARWARRNAPDDWLELDDGDGGKFRINSQGDWTHRL